jgi:hypothetical protein
VDLAVALAGKLQTLTALPGQKGRFHMDLSQHPVNGNGNSVINGRGIKHRGLTHRQFVGLAADAVAGIHPVVPSLGQVPAIFSGVTQAEVSAELKRREAARKDNEADNALFAFADVWGKQSLAWRVDALKLIATESDLFDIRFALNAATS